jgi:hypothetical protein
MPSNLLLSIAILKRDISYLMQNKELPEYRSILTKKRKESGIIEALKNIRQANRSSLKSKEANRRPSVISAGS